MEAEQLKKLLPVRKNDDIGVGSGNNGVGSDSSVTGILVLSAFAAACGTFMCGSALGYSSPTESGIMADLGLSVAEFSVFGSVLTVGGMIGAAAGGKISDLMGRRRAMWVLDLFYISGWLAILFAKNAWMLDLGRLSLGFGIAINSYVVPVYVAEITPRNLRGGILSCVQWMTGLSISVSFLVGSMISWRTLAGLGTIPCLVQLVVLFFIPESPRWLAKVSREKESEAALLRLRGKNADISEEVADIRECVEELRCISRDGILDVFQRKYSHSLIVGIGLMLLQQLGGINAYVFYTNAIFSSAGISSIVGFTTVSAFPILIGVLATFLMDRSGRRLLLLASAAGACLGSFLTGLSCLLQEHYQWKEITPILALISVMVYTASFSLGVGGIPGIIISEIFPINVKGTAGSICNLINWLCSWVVAYTFNFLLQWSSTGTFFIYSSINGLGVVFIALLVPETKGRALEEIQASLTK